jgi:lipopolysaccharide O-acetyltransferase
LNRFWQFLKENGFYMLGTTLTEQWTSLVRNHQIARRLGVNKIHIGPRAHLRGLSSIEMGEDFRAGDGLWLEAITKYDEQVFSPRIVIGQHVRISHFVHIAATNFVEIGDHVLMGSKVMITDHNHGQYSGEQHSSPHIAPPLRLLDHARRTVIGRNVWLGDGVVVTAGASIGEGSVIGANSVVLGGIPPFVIAAGIPATVRKTFNFDTGKWCNVQ